MVQGLGKTLQGIALLWTLLQSGHELLGGSPIAKRVIIVCPTSLVNNWCARACLADSHSAVRETRVSTRKPEHYEKDRDPTAPNSRT